MARVSSLLSGLTVASASPLGQFVNLATCNCLTKDASNAFKLVHSPCETPMSDAQAFWVDSDATVHNGDQTMTISYAGAGSKTSHGLMSYFAGNQAFKVDAAPETAEYLHLINTEYAGKQGVLKEGDDDQDYNYPATAMDDDDQAQRFVFVCETCAHNVPPCQDPTPAPAPGPDPTVAPEPTPTPGDLTTPSPAAGVQIQSTVSSLCVDLPGGDTSTGALLWTWDCYGGDTQQWAFQDGQLVYVPDPSKCVSLLGGDTNRGSRLALLDCHQGDSQQWGFNSETGALYLSSYRHGAGRCVQIEGENQGDLLIINGCTHQPDQTWTVGSPQSSLAVV